MAFKEYVKKHERHIGALAVVLGFVWDSLTFARPDQLLGNAVLVAYLVISAGGILFLAGYAKRGTAVPMLLLAMIQFAFGNLAGGFLVVYGRSGVFEGNYLFMLILGAFIIGNEFLRDKYSRVNFHISTWYFLSLLYFTLVVPMIFGRMGDGVFILSGIASLVTVGCFLIVLSVVSKKAVIGAFSKTFFSVAAIFIVFNALYFSNTIPPVPLSLRGIGMYHSVERMAEGNYRATYEKPTWYEFSRDTNKIFNKFEGEDVYCFSSVFAPVKISTGINHRWEYYNDAIGKWQTTTLVSFPIVGGRDGGYRGYSQKSNPALGRWRCSVETTGGVLIGRTTFNVVARENPLMLYEKNL
ncbi:MAG: DUF2914 domain-containing protein [Patescibacteria group bacterium]